MFDPTVIEFGGVTIIAMVFGLVQFFKELFKVEGKAATAMALVMAAVVYGVSQSIQFLPPNLVPYFEVAYQSIAFGLSAAGFYKFGTRNG